MRMRMLVIAFAFVAVSVQAFAAGSPQDTVKSFDDALIAAMKAGKSAGVQGRSAVVEPAIDRAFDLAEMTRLILGSAGKALAPEQSAKIVAAFRLYTIANYAKNFEAFSGERFEVDAPRPGGVGAIVVPGRLIPADGAQPVQLDYVLKGGEDQWKITDVLAEGAVSQMAARRAEFVGILRKDGVDGLVATIEAKTKALTTEVKAPAGEH